MQRDISFTSENSWNSNDSIHVPRSTTNDLGKSEQSIENDDDDQASEASSTGRAEPSSQNLNEEKKEIQPYNSKEPSIVEHKFPNDRNESFQLEINSTFESEHQVTITFGTTTYGMVATTNKIVVKRDTL